MHPLRGWQSAWWPWLLLCGWMLCVAPASAHLVAAQRGTLNIVGDAAFLVLSVPVSAMQGVDDDGDGLLSKPELQRHADALHTQLLGGVQLRGPEGALPLQLVMVDIASPDNAPAAAASHLSVLGRFQLRPAGAGGGGLQASAPDGLSLRFALFGAKASERQQDLTITRQNETQWLRFTPTRNTHALLPSTLSVLAEHVQTGAAHVLGGADHLLFLLVVLSAAWGWRALLGALTCFTAGHALTLVACVCGGWSAPGHIVEPAIAATIVGMAAFDAWGRWRGRPARLPTRLALVFACALIHGLGLAGALTDLTQWPPGSSPMLWALAGFNLGVELAQVAVAAVACLLWWGLHHLLRPAAQRRTSQFATLAVMAAGSIWFAERLLQSS
jgi:hypothetical protein